MSKSGRFSQSQAQPEMNYTAHSQKPRQPRKGSGAVLILAIIAAVLVLVVAGLIGVLAYTTTMEKAAAVRAQELAEYAAAMAEQTEAPTMETILLETEATEAADSTNETVIAGEESQPTGETEVPAGTEATGETEPAETAGETVPATES